MLEIQCKVRRCFTYDGRRDLIGECHGKLCTIIETIIDPCLEKVFLGNDVKIIEYYFLFNNYDLPKRIFYPVTGVYKCRYLKKTKEIRVDLCYDNVIEINDYETALNIMKELFIKATEQICNKCETKKLDFNIRLFSDIINNAIKNFSAGCA